MGDFAAMKSVSDVSLLMNKIAPNRHLSPFDGTRLFEEGMVEVLRELALTTLFAMDVPASDAYFKAEEVTENKRDSMLTSALPDHQKEALIEYEEALNFSRLLENEDHFVAGFLAGYRFLKQLKR
ncbi:hypothetical protein [Paenibacillus gansuensis]|uniref:Uncharacterized protein n=1 Tax=Paenibacillus gansuensis TaxID=306542 RepID=A0ABW5PGB2_9BACL